MDVTPPLIGGFAISDVALLHVYKNGIAMSAVSDFRIERNRIAMDAPSPDYQNQAIEQGEVRFWIWRDTRAVACRVSAAVFKDT